MMCQFALLCPRRGEEGGGGKPAQMRSLSNACGSFKFPDAESTVVPSTYFDVVLTLRRSLLRGMHAACQRFALNRTRGPPLRL